VFFFFQAEDGIRDRNVTGVQTCALPILKIRIGQQNPEIGNLEKNFRLIEEAVHAAESADIDLLLLPELATCGYFPKDMLRHQSFLDEIYAMNAALAALVTDMTVSGGSITTNNHGK